MQNSHLFKIGDFSQIGQVSVRMLRHYDELGLLKPAYVDRLTDYRYYSLEQLPKLNRLLALKDLGFSLVHIAELLNDDLPAPQLRGMFFMKRAEIEQQLQEGQARLARVEARLKQIEQEGRLSDYEVVLKKIEPMMIASARQVVPALLDMQQYRRMLFAEVYDWLAQSALKSVASELVIYSNTEYTEQDIDTEVAVVVDKASLRSRMPPIAGRVRVRELPAVLTMASVIHQGYLQDVGQAISALFAWIGVHGYSACGAEREVHLFGREHDLTLLAPVVIEMQLPVEKTTPIPL